MQRTTISVARPFRAAMTTGLVLTCVVPAWAGMYYPATITVEPETICVGGLATVTVAIAPESSCIECPQPPFCPPLLDHFVAQLMLTGARFVGPGTAPCTATETLGGGHCVTCNDVFFSQYHQTPCFDCWWTFPFTGCGPYCQAFTIAPGQTKVFCVQGETPGPATVTLWGARPCGTAGSPPHPYGNDWIDDVQDFDVIGVNIETDSDNDNDIDANDNTVEDVFPGRHLWPNADDDNGNGQPDLNAGEPAPLPGENDLAEIHVDVQPAYASIPVTLTAAPNDLVKVWLDPGKTTPAPMNWNAENLPYSLWVEGLDNAGTATLTLSAGSCSDSMVITVFKVAPLGWGVYSNNTLLEFCENNPGLRIFPDRQTPADTADYRRKVYVTGSVEPIAQNVRVYLGDFDVDDPSAEGDAVDTRPGDVPNAGPDNRGTDSLLEQSLAHTDASGAYQVTYNVTMCPGDNFRIMATTSPQVLNVPAGSGTYPASSVQQWAETGQGMPPGLRRGGMLTVWRRLWVESDSMAYSPDYPVNSTLAQVWNSTPHSGESGATMSGFEPNDNGRYEKGPLMVYFGGAYQIIDHWDDYFDDTLYVSGDLTGDLGRNASFVDDDGNELARLADTSILNEKLRPAYTKCCDAGNSQLNAPFVNNVEDTESGTANVAAPVKNLTTSADCWVVEILSCHQANRDNDGDPDKWYHYHSVDDKKDGDQSLVFGSSPLGGRPGGTDDNISLIFLETIRDWAAQEAWRLSIGAITPPVFTQSQRERKTVVHEVGHLFGCNHADGGIMTPGVGDPSLVFTPESLNTIRGSICIGVP